MYPFDTQVNIDYIFICILEASPIAFRGYTLQEEKSKKVAPHDMP